MVKTSRTAGERWTCVCGEELVGALTINQKVAPVTLRCKDNGNVWLGRNSEGVVICATLGGPLLDKARDVGVTLHLNHFADCPDRARFETKR